jgi:ribonuclease PH
VRQDGRDAGDLRPVRFQLGVNRHAEGSCYMELGDTHVLATASVEDKVPPFLRGQGQGWVHAEYGMLPRSTHERTPREVTRGRPQGRTMEIQRLIARALRAVTHLDRLGERTFIVDVDVLQADGGTRTAGITAGFLALMAACHRVLGSTPLFTDWLAAVSCGLKGDEAWLDLTYVEDAQVDVDFNCAMTRRHKLVEVQGAGERRPYSPAELERLMDLATRGIDRLTAVMTAAYPEGEPLVDPNPVGSGDA